MEKNCRRLLHSDFFRGIKSASASCRRPFRTSQEIGQRLASYVGNTEVTFSRRLNPTPNANLEK